jgi:hypothetical protein
MHRRPIFILLIVSLLAVFGAAPVSGQANLLVNPSFEGPVSPRFDDCAKAQANELGTPDGWLPYYKCRSQNDPEYTNFRPEFGTIPASFFAYRVRSGATALKFFNFFARQESSGVYQTVANVAPGQWLQFSLWVQLWTSNCDASVLPNNETSSLYEPGNLEARVCIDTDGGALDFDAGTVCGDWARERAWDRYAQVSVSAPAAAASVNVVLNTRAEWPVKHNDAYADDAELFAIATPITNVVRGPRRVLAPTIFNERQPPFPDPAPRCPKPAARLFGPSVE